MKRASPISAVRGSDALFPNDSGEDLLIKKLINVQAECIVAHDSCEGRLDHVMANIDTLFQAPGLTSIPLYLVSGESLSCLLRPGRNVIEVNDNRCGQWCSLVPIGQPCPRITTTGLKYNVSEYFLVC